MGEIWVRLLLVAGALVVVALVISLTRRRRRSGRVFDAAGLRPGVYLFTSATCADCVAARARLAEGLGVSGFAEIEWEKDPDLFTQVGIELVPSTVVVTPDGTATRYPGIPDRLLERLNP